MSYPSPTSSSGSSGGYASGGSGGYASGSSSGGYSGSSSGGYSGGRGGRSSGGDRDRGDRGDRSERGGGGSRMRGRGAPARTDPTSIDYKNIDVLERFVDEGGRIRSRRRSRVDAISQHRVTRAVKLARFMALLPYTPDHVRLYGGRS